MRRSAVVVLLLVAGLPAAERNSITFRLRKDAVAPQHGWILEFSEEGFRFQYFGAGRRVSIQWDDLVEEDAHALRVRLGLEPSDEEKSGLVDAHEVHFKGGSRVRGVLELVDEEQRHWIRHDGVVLPYPGDRVEEIDEIRLPGSEVYTPDEIYFRRLERHPPITPNQHRDLAERMFDVGNWTRALEHYNVAMRMRPDWRGALTPRVVEIEEILEDEGAQAEYRRAKVRAVLFGDYLGAIRSIEDYIGLHPAAKRRGLLVIDEIRNKRMAKLQALYHRAKAEAFDRGIRRYLVRKAPTLEEAMSWVTESLTADVMRRVRSRLELSGDELAMLRESQPKCAPHWATYKDGTFVVSERAVRGRLTKRTVRGDRDAWWEALPDVNTRSTFLKAYGAERLPDLFEVVQVRQTPCVRCGGRGTVRIFSFRSDSAGRHEHRQTCPRCFGSKEDRGVGYR